MLSIDIDDVILQRVKNEEVQKRKIGKNTFVAGPENHGVCRWQTKDKR